MEACDFVRKRFVKASSWKFSNNLEIVTWKNPYGKTSLLESPFRQINGIKSRLVSFAKKRLHQRHLPVNILELLAFLQEGLTWAPFFWYKTEGCVLQGCNVIKKLVHHRLFLKILFFKTASFWFIFQKVSVMSYLNSKIAVLTLQVCCNFIEKTPSQTFSWEISKLLPSIIFCNIFISAEEACYIENYLKARRSATGKEELIHFFILSTP